jgi:arylsulfatase A-like enzyme
VSLRLRIEGREELKVRNKIPLLTTANNIAFALLLILFSATAVTYAQEAPLDRTVLPIPQPVYPTIRELDARNATPPPLLEVKAPKNAPNVLIILLDDMGFGQPSTFGGPVHMPTLDHLARAGAALQQLPYYRTVLTDSRGVAHRPQSSYEQRRGLMDIATAFPGNNGIRPNSIAMLPEILRLNGYSTAAFGKWHLTPPWELSISGPTYRWPVHSGFDKFYGFMGGETNQYSPLIYDGSVQVEIPHEANYHFMTDMTDQAISWVRAQKSLTPDRPFFIYFAPGAVHAPHQVPKEWIAKYKGQFDEGWDRLRDQTLARQIELGVVPSGTKLAPKPAAIKPWNSLSADEKKLFARQMEVFAGFGEMADYEIGRLIQAIQDLGQLNNTLIFYIAGDNGASAEGGMNGLYNEASYFNGLPEPIEAQLKHLDDLGGPKANNHYAAGWAVAGDTPFTWTKQVASNYSGTRNGLVITWPARIAATGGLRQQFHHVIDIAPTILEAAGLPQPKEVNGTAQIPMQGVSMLYTFDDAAAKSRHTTQYFEIAGNRAIYQNGWLAGTVHRAPWERTPRALLKNDKWELYDTTRDFSLSNDLASTNPAKLKQMQKIFIAEAIKNHVLPIDDRGIERLNPALAGRPDLMAGRTSLTVYPGMRGMMEDTFINIKNRSHSVTAHIEISSQRANGVIICQGGRFGGWSLYLKDGKPKYAYNWIGLQTFTIAGTRPIPPGKATIRFEFDYDGGGLGAGGVGKLSVDGEQVAQGRITKTTPLIFSPDEGADVGIDEGTPVTGDYPTGNNAFNGKIDDVIVEVKPQDPNVKDKEEKASQRLLMDRIADD